MPPLGRALDFAVGGERFDLRNREFGSGVIAHVACECLSAYAHFCIRERPRNCRANYPNRRRFFELFADTKRDDAIGVRRLITDPREAQQWDAES
jgi:hypothetical protein